MEEDTQVIFLIPKWQNRKKATSSHVVLFILTLISVLFAGGLYGLDTELPQNTGQMILTILKNGWPFAVSLLAILALMSSGIILWERNTVWM